MSEQIRQRVMGTIVGQAIGDAMGHPTEFSKHGPPVTSIRPGQQYTDDTQMMMAVAESILNASPVKWGEDLWMKNMGEQFVRWDDGDKDWGLNNRAPGGACMSSVRAFRASHNWKTAGGLSAKGNGSVMRASVIGAAFCHDPAYAFRLGGLSSVISHNNLEPMLGSAALCSIIAFAIKGVSLPSAITQTLEYMRDWEFLLPFFPKSVALGTGHSEQNPYLAIARVGQAYTAAKSACSLKEWRQFNGDDFKGIEALAAALFYNARYNNYRTIITGLANNTGDSDTTAAIGGAIAGARWGLQFIPSEWRRNIEASAYLHSLGEKIYEFSQAHLKKDTSVAATR